MKKFLKWTGLVVAALGAVALMAFAWVFFASERVLSREYAAADRVSLAIPSDATAIAEGHRIAQLSGCLHCHGEKLNGGLVDDIPHLVRLVAPNISTMLPEYTDAQLIGMLRKGVKRDGTSVLFMPSEMYRHLRDEDLARLIAYLRTVPATPEGVQESTEVRIVGRALLALGEVKPAALAIETLPAADRQNVDHDALSQGRNRTMTLCSECHGQSLEGFAPINAPPLSVVKGYSLEQFTRLMREGAAIGDHPLKLMRDTARARFVALTPEEMAAMHAFLQSRS